MKRILAGIATGIAAGIIDLIPMVFQNISLNGCLSAFFMWVVIGFMISTNTLKLKGILKGIVLSLLILLPMSFIIAWNEPLTLVPVGVMTIVLGAVSGVIIEKICGKTA